VNIIPTQSNDILFIKLTFLRFLQAYFSLLPSTHRFYWSPTVSTRTFHIMDKYSYAELKKDKRYGIVLSRGYISDTGSAINQMATNSLMTQDIAYSDLYQATVTLNCLSKNGIEAEELANMVRTALLSYKASLRSAGIFKIQRVAIGEEAQLRLDDREVSTVIPVNVQFFIQSSVATYHKYGALSIQYSCNFEPETQTTPTNPYYDILTDTLVEGVTSKTLDVTFIENIDYTVCSGDVVFTTAPTYEFFIVSGEQSTTGPNDDSVPAFGSTENLRIPGWMEKGKPTWTLTFLSSADLSEVTDTLSVDSVTTTFTPSVPIYGYTERTDNFTFQQTVTDD